MFYKVEYQKRAHQEVEKIFRVLFPEQGLAVREEQIRLCHEMLDTLLGEQIALCDAGVGIGKTYAYLVACVLLRKYSMLTGRGNPLEQRPVVVSTSSIALQTAILTEYIPFLSRVLLEQGIIQSPLRAVVRKGKEHFVCDNRLEQRIEAIRHKQKNAVQKAALLSLRKHYDMDSVKNLSGFDRRLVCVPKFCPRECPGRQMCRYQRYLEESRKQDVFIQICNHNYLLADAYHRAEGYKPLLSDYRTLIVDEAHCIRYSGAEEKELSMCFNFHHLKVDYKDGNKWELMEPDYMELKVIFEKWQMGMQRGNAWNALFWCNHDQPRIVSRFGNEGEYWKESAKMLAGMIHLMRGTPYIYQGEEIGMTNPHYTSIEQYADVESRNYYEILLNEGKTKEEALEILAARSRDNSRTPMQWTDERYCGFSDTKPWIPVSDNFEKINVKKQKQDRDSILEFYKKLIMLRKEKEVIARGNIEFMEVENAGVLAYTRCLDKQKLLVCCNFRDVESQMEFTQEWKSGRKILGNYEENHKNNYKVLTLRPYEIIVLEKGEE